MLILKLTDKNLKKTIKETLKIIKKGGVVICPTDTVYGLISDATNRKAVEKVFKIKKRPKEKPIPVFIRDIKMARNFAQIEKKQEIFLKKAWPGKTTFILKRKNKLPGMLFRGRKTIGLRIPKYKLINILLERLNGPLSGTSANISGRPAWGKIKEVLRQFENQKSRPDLIIDAGNLKPSRPSKIIDLTFSKPKTLRK